MVRTDKREKSKIDDLLLEGLNSGTPINPDDNYWKNKKKALK